MLSFITFCFSTFAISCIEFGFPLSKVYVFPSYQSFLIMEICFIIRRVFPHAKYISRYTIMLSKRTSIFTKLNISPWVVTFSVRLPDYLEATLRRRLLGLHGGRASTKASTTYKLVRRSRISYERKSRASRFWETNVQDYWIRGLQDYRFEYGTYR